MQSPWKQSLQSLANSWKRPSAHFFLLFFLLLHAAIKQKGLDIILKNIFNWIIPVHVTELPHWHFTDKKKKHKSQFHFKSAEQSSNANACYGSPACTAFSDVAASLFHIEIK